MALNLGELTAYLSLDRGDFDGGLRGATDSLTRFRARGAATALAASAGIAAALGGGIAEGLDLQDAQAKLTAQLDLTGPESARLGKVAGSLFAGNYGDNMGQVNEAIKGVVNNISGMARASDADLQDVTANVLSVAQAFDQDLGGTTRAVGQLIKTGLAKDANAALDIITKGMQNGANGADDLLDTFTEYPTQFRKLGLDGQTALGLISQGLKDGARDSDIVADALKEFSIRAVDGSKLTKEGFEGLGLSAAKMADQIAKGGPAARAGLDTVLDKLRAVKDPAERSRLAVALFGTQAEDLGDALYALDPSKAVQGLGQVAGAAGRVNATLGATASSNLESFRRKAQLALVDLIGGQVIPRLTSAATALSAGFAPALDAVGGALGVVGPALQALTGWLSQHTTTAQVLAAVVGGALVTAFTLWGLVASVSAAKATAAWVTSSKAAVTSAWGQVMAGARVAAGWVLMGVQSTVQAARMAAAWVIAMGPVAWVAAAVIGLVALVVANWDTVKKVTGAAWTWVSGKVKEAAAFIVRAFTNWTLPGLILKHWDTIKSNATSAWNGIVAFVKGVPGKIHGAFLNFTVIGLIVKHWATIRANANSAWDGIVGWLKGVPGRIGAAFSSFPLISTLRGHWSTIKSNASAGMNGLLGVVRGIPAQIVAVFTGLGGQMAAAGEAIIRDLAAGIMRVASVPVDAVRGIVGRVAGLLPHSPAKEGPFSGRGWSRYSGESIMSDLAAGIDATGGRAVAATSSAMRGVSGALTASGPLPGAGTVSAARRSLPGQSITVNIHEAQTTSDVEVMRGIDRALTLAGVGAIGG